MFVVSALFVFTPLLTSTGKLVTVELLIEALVFNFVNEIKVWFKVREIRQNAIHGQCLVHLANFFFQRRLQTFSMRRVLCEELLSYIV